MATPRRFGQEVSQNIRRPRNMTLSERDKAIGMLVGGCTIPEVAQHFGRADSTIRRLHLKHHHTGTIVDKPRSGRPHILSRHTKKLLFRAVRKTPKIEYKHLSKVAQIALPDGTLQKAPSRSTLYRVLKKRGLTNYRCKTRPKLTRGRALARLKFCREYRSFPWQRRTLKFSDKCSIQKGSGHNTEWCFRYPDEKWTPSMITEHSTSRAPAQMVWGAIWLDERGRPRRSPLVIMDRDSDAPHNGYTSQSYIQALRKGLLPNWRKSQLFMQDNARIHTSATTRAFLEDHHITTIKWPPYSPDLNPIEHL
jgi:transposase